MPKLSERAVARMFEEERAVFSKTFPDVLRVGLAIIDRHFVDGERPRDVAWFDEQDNHIYLVRKSLSRSLNCLRGVIRHELGHAVDEHINEDGCERRADYLAELATGVPIRYTKEGLQHATRGEPYRPDWLHQ